MNIEYVARELQKQMVNVYQMRLGNAIMDKEREDILLRLDRLIGDSNGNSKYRSN